MFTVTKRYYKDRASRQTHTQGNKKKNNNEENNTGTKHKWKTFRV
jgi:hypothetical protein